MRNKRVARATAGEAELGPRLATTTALRTSRAQQDFNRHDGAAIRFLARQTDFRLQRLRTLAGAIGKKGLADARDEMTDRGKIDRDLVGETIGIGFQRHAR